MTYLSDIYAAGLEQVRRSWGWFLALGILLVALGVVCIGKAQTATSFSILALGWILMISAVIWFVNAFFAFNWQGFFLYLLNAIIRGVCGYLLVSHPQAGSEGVTIALAILFIVGGLYRAIASSIIQFPRWGWMMFAGLVSVALGIYLLVIWRTASPFFFGLVIGIDLIFDGAALVGFASAIHSLPGAQVRKAA
jgi:uncharacterized membrane protein HdeD (DUF308 family)